MKLSTIVVTYKRREPLRRCLESIYAQQDILKPYEIILVDNGGDADIPQLSSTEITLHVERPGENLGVAGGRNWGIKRAQGEALIFIDDDATWHDPHCVARLLDDLETLPHCAAVAVKVLDPEDDSPIINLLPYPNKHYAAALNTPTEAPYYYGGAHILRSAAVRRVGLYPERYFYSMEEVDICLRLFDAGYRVYYDPGAAIYHQRATSVTGPPYWVRNALNKSRVAWRLLPQPYPLTTLFVWSAAALFKTRQPKAVFELWRKLWSERKLLASERHPIRAETVRHLRQIGARLYY
jgi:GT2 family glycosyltransferase